MVEFSPSLPEEAVTWQVEQRVTLPKGNPRRDQAIGDGGMKHEESDLRMS